jgi:hypothetical protein
MSYSKNKGEKQARKEKQRRFLKFLKSIRLAVQQI